MEAIEYKQIYKESFCDENYTFYFGEGKGKMKKKEGARERQKREGAKQEEMERKNILLEAMFLTRQKGMGLEGLNKGRVWVSKL